LALVKTQNYEDGSDARYDVSQMTEEERSHFDGEGRPLGSDYAPDQWTWTDGIIGARGGGGAGGGGGGGGGGMSPDAYFQQVKSMLMAQKQSEEASTKGMLQKLLIGFGMVPEGFEGQDKLGVLDDLTKDLIQKNTSSGISQYARLLEAKGDNTKALIGRLSHTGMRRSGAKGAKLRKGQLDYDRLLSDSLQEVLSQISGAYGNMASNEQQRQMQLLAALQNSQNSWSSTNSPTRSSDPSSPTPPPASTPWSGWGLPPGGDYGGYVPGSGKITDFGGNPTVYYKPGGGGLGMY
jgi:hypothetical protein